MKFLNGVQIAQDMTKKSLSPEVSFKAERIVTDVFERRFNGKQELLDGQNMLKYHKELIQVIEECKKNEIDYKVTHAWLNVILDRYENSIWRDSSAGQKADLFVASNSSEINIDLMFGGGIKVENNIMHGNFGKWINVRKPIHVEDTNDFVPFSYLLTHNNIPAAIVFLSVGDSTQECHGSGCKTLEITKTSENSCNPAGLAYLRLLKYVTDVRNSNHYADLQAYHHARINPDTKKAEFVRIPLIAAIYDTNSRVVYKVGKDCKTGQKLKDYLYDSNLVNDFRLHELARHLQLHEQDEAYTTINRNNRHIKQTGCVDLRIRNILSTGGLIKEIGSIFKKQERQRILDSDICNYVIDTSHSNCGYLNTLVAIHVAGNEMRTQMNDSNPKLRKMLESSLQKLSDGRVDVLFGAAELDAAIYEFGEHRLSNTTIKTLHNLISETGNDTRKTVRHAIKRDKTISKDGFLIFPVAKAIEDITREIIPNRTLSKEHFDLLVTEQSARENFEEYGKLQNTKGIIVTEAIIDLKTGNKLIPQERLPENFGELTDTSRSLFYRPQEKIELKHGGLDY